MTEHADGIFSMGSPPVSEPFARRIQAAYRLATALAPAVVLPIWSTIAARSRGVHDALLADDPGPLRHLLATPAEHDLFFGFDNLFKDDVAVHKGSEDLRTRRVTQLAWMIVRLAEALGCRRLHNPEDGSAHPAPYDTRAGVFGLLDAIEGVTGPFAFPNPFPEEHGLATPRGIVSYRAIHAIYQSVRARSLSERYGTRILEIGAGLGRSAYFARQFGLRDYVVVDLPLTLVAQAAFLAHAIGEDQLALTGETRKPGQVALYSPEFLPETGLGFDVVVNVDSLTEMGDQDIDAYLALVERERAVLLSINHEKNAQTMRHAGSIRLRQEYRAPYWLRDGYAEELFVPKL